jgi:hypothetical protein
MDDELRRAAERLAQAAGRRSDAPSHDESINAVLDVMRRGDPPAGYRQLIHLAKGGSGAAWHFLAWIQRYRAEIALREAVELHERAIAAGYEPSRLHLEKVRAALDIVDYPKPEQLRSALGLPPEEPAGDG